jgi:hypothetical protein
MVHTNMLLYEQVASITEDYFGPAAPRYIERLISTRFHKPAAELKPEDMPELIEWVRLSMAVLTEQERAIDDITSRLSSLYSRVGRTSHAR